MNPYKAQGYATLFQGLIDILTDGIDIDSAKHPDLSITMNVFYILLFGYLIYYALISKYWSGQKFSFKFSYRSSLLYISVILLIATILLPIILVGKNIKSLTSSEESESTEKTKLYQDTMLSPILGLSYVLIIFIALIIISIIIGCFIAIGSIFFQKDK